MRIIFKNVDKRFFSILRHSPSVFSSIFAAARTACSHLRSLHSDAHIGSLGVVEADDALKLGSAFLAGSDGHLVQQFGIQDAVGALRDGVLKRVPALGHAYADAMALQFRHLGVAAVLTAPVRMLDEAPGRSVVYGRERHPKGLQRIYGLQGRTDRPADDLVRVCVQVLRLSQN